jgi:hypothetical protein
LLARLAAFGFVLQTFVVEKRLFACGPNEGFIAVDASNGLVLVFGVGIRGLDFFPV